MNRSALALAGVILSAASLPAAARQTPAPAPARAPSPAPTPAPQPAASQPAAAPGGNRLSPSELEELLGPIALYPDALLANVLAASVYPDEVFAAAAFVGAGNKGPQIDAQSWEPPVKAVAQVPDAIKMMADYRDWTIALGQAYILQAKDVMDVVQILRRKADANGALKTTPQQQVVVQQETVYIKSTDPEIVYVPSYSPSVVYVDNDDSDVVAAGVIGFGVGVATGLVLANMDCNWHGGCVGWGHGGGYYGGNNDITINNNFNRNNINNGNINTGNIGSGNGNRVGNEGNAFAPNRSKQLASSMPSQAGRFNSAAGARQVPGGGMPRTNAAATRPTGTQANRPAGAQAANRPAAAQNRPATPQNRPAAAQNRPATPTASRVPQTPPRQSSPSAFQGGRDTSAASSRGAQSRGSSGSAAARGSSGGRSSAGGGRSGGGRSGGGGGRGGGGRR